MAKDVFHDTVKLALQKDGWTITHDPYRLRYGIADIYIDLAAEEAISAKKAGRKTYSGLQSHEVQAMWRDPRLLQEVGDLCTSITRKALL